MIEIIDQTPDRETWNSLVKQCNGTIFHSYEWLNLLEENFNQKTYYLLAKKDGKLTGGFPYYKLKKGPATLLVSPLPKTETMYGGPIALDGSVKQNLIKAFLGKNASLYYIKSEDMGFAQGFDIQPNKNYILNFKKTKEELWNSLNKKTRNAVRKAEKLCVEIIEADNLQNIDTYYHILSMNFEKLNLNPLPLNFYRNLFKELAPKGMAKFLLAKYDNKFVAGGVFLIFNQNLVYLSGSSYPEYRFTNANNLIQWNLISWAAENKLKSYDLGGAGVPSIAKFKAGFGGKEVNYYRLSKTRGIARPFVKMYLKLR
jgi:hypothetical protein